MSINSLVQAKESNITDTTLVSDVVDLPKKRKPKPPGTGPKPTSADRINVWANNEIIPGDTNEFLTNLLQSIQQDRPVCLRGSRAKSLDRFNPT